RNDQFVDERVRHSRDLDPRAFQLRGLPRRAQLFFPVAGRARIHANDRVMSHSRSLVIACYAADWYLDGDRADVGATEAVDAERIDEVGVFIRPSQHRQIATQVQRVKDSAQIDVEGFGTLAGKN